MFGEEGVRDGLAVDGAGWVDVVGMLFLLGLVAFGRFALGAGGVHAFLEAGELVFVEVKEGESEGGGVGDAGLGLLLLLGGRFPDGGFDAVEATEGPEDLSEAEDGEFFGGGFGFVGRAEFAEEIVEGAAGFAAEDGVVGEAGMAGELPRGCTHRYGLLRGFGGSGFGDGSGFARVWAGGDGLGCAVGAFGFGGGIDGGLGVDGDGRLRRSRFARLCVPWVCTRGDRKLRGFGGFGFDGCGMPRVCIGGEGLRCAVGGFGFD